RMAQPTRLVRLFTAGVLDRLGALLGRQPRYVPAGVAAGEFGAVANTAAFAGLDIIRPRDGSEWHNRVAARSLLGIGAHRPVRKAAHIRCPILLVVAENDTIPPVSRRRVVGGSGATGYCASPRLRFTGACESNSQSPRAPPHGARSMTDTRDMLNASPTGVPLGVDEGAAAIDACLNCLQACTSCVDSHLVEA